MDRRTKDVLRVIDHALAEGNRELWDLLTALRGPDDGYDMDKAKYHFTAPLRGILLPECVDTRKSGPSRDFTLTVGARFSTKGINPDHVQSLLMDHSGAFCFEGTIPPRNWHVPTHWRSHMLAAIRALKEPK